MKKLMSELTLAVAVEVDYQPEQMMRLTRDGWDEPIPEDIILEAMTVNGVNIRDKMSLKLVAELERLMLWAVKQSVVEDVDL